jgi:hypothetical protein
MATNTNQENNESILCGRCDTEVADDYSPGECHGCEIDICQDCGAWCESTESWQCFVCVPSSDQPCCKNEETTCPKCYLIECCCEADKLEDLKNKKLEIQMFHNAKPGSRTFRKIKECPCGQHAEEYGELDRFQEARALLEKDVPFDEWGDERLDKWVRETYGDEADWALLSTMSQAEKDLAIKLLPEFVVSEQHGRNTETGIAVVFRDLDSD